MRLAGSFLASLPSVIPSRAALLFTASVGVLVGSVLAAPPRAFGQTIQETKLQAPGSASLAESVDIWDDVVVGASEPAGATGLIIDANGHALTPGLHPGAVLDTATDLLWLDATETAGRSLADIQSKLGTGQEFESWSLATRGQIHQMFLNADLRITSPGQGWTEDLPLRNQAQSLVAIYGQTRFGTASSYFGTNVWHADTFDYPGQIGGETVGWSDNSPEGVWVGDNGTSSSITGKAVGDWGVALVRCTTASGVEGQSITVNSIEDVLSPGDGLCTLREAIINANANCDQSGGDCVAGSGADTIELPAGTYSIDIQGSDEDQAETGDLDVTDDLTLAGASTESTTILGGVDTIIHVAAANLEVSDLTLDGGTASHFFRTEYRGHVWVTNVVMIPDPTPCQDGIDNDGDSLTDLSDPGCTGPEDLTEKESTLPCDNGLDDDGDGLTDFPHDPGCAYPASQIEDPECDDGIDNDGDAAIDFPDDLSCQSRAWYTEFGACNDGVDNDQDGAVDYPDDSGCLDVTDESEQDPSQVCDNGLDEDEDGLADFPLDPGCADLQDVSERSDALVCDDGLDNDGDTANDFPQDPGCRDPVDSSEEFDCSDGLDNDGDGFVDFPADSGCLDASGPLEASVTIEVDAGAPDAPTTDGTCSLREAIINTNDDAATWPDCPRGSGPDEIILPSETFGLSSGSLVICG